MKLIFAPMATISHAGFRELLEVWGGCDLYYTEMIAASTFLAGGPFEKWYEDSRPSPQKVVYQIIGVDTPSIAEAARRLATNPVHGIDLNMGCSAPHICRSGGGVVWMSDTEKAKALVGACKIAVGDKKLSVKIRLGEEENPEKLLLFCNALQAEGLDAITLHPRIRKDKLSRPSRWSHVAMLKRELKIPVYGNGDLKEYADLKRRDIETAADGYMVGRQACKAPWTFGMWKLWESDPQAEFTVDMRQVVEKFHQFLEVTQPPEFWPTRTQRFYDYFSHNFIFGNRLGARVYLTKNYDAIRAGMMEYLDTHPEECVQVFKSGIV